MRRTLMLLILVGLAPAAGIAPAARADWREDVDRALAQVAASRGDLSVPANYTDPDSFRIGLVSHWMEDPLSAPGALGGMARGMEGGASKAAENWRGVLGVSDAGRIEGANRGASPTVPGLLEHKPKAHAGKWQELPEKLQVAFSPVIGNLERAAEFRSRMLDPLSKKERTFLEARACSLLINEPGVEKMSLFQIHRDELRHMALADSVFKLCRRLDRTALMDLVVQAAYLDQGTLGDSTLFDTHDWKLDKPKKDAPRSGPGGVVEGSVAFWGETDLGAVVIGGPERNVYRGSFAIIIDPGGDDLYELAGAAAGGPAFQFIYDAAGNDVYRASGDGGLGAGYFGAGALVDAHGDDLYEASRFSIGSGFFGLGVLEDREGDDRYFADTASEGSAAFGLGILSDQAGDDLYQCRLESQGFGYVQGIGLLHDRSGDDVYLARQAYTDVLRYDDQSLTLCQGFGFGERPFASGGIGILHDESGNDAYSADVYGQGSSYWWAVGVLLDDAGNDHYDAQQYAQGAGIHLALGYLLDSGGDDRYTAWSCAQGCGHDLGTGLLLDLEGADMYASSDLSQGAGNANGNGLAVDLSGADGYLALNDRTSQGYGNPRRDTQSLGALIDLAGRDVHAPNGGDAAITAGTTLGVILDAPAEGPGRKSAGEVTVPYAERDYTTEEFFLMAAAGEPRFREWQARGVKELADHPDRSIRFLVTRLSTPIARERQTIKDIFRVIGLAGIQPLADALPAADADGRATAAWILGEIGRAEAAPVLLTLVRDPSWRVRSAALGAFGKLHGVTVDRAFSAAIEPALTEALTDTAGPEFVAKDAAYAAGKLGLTGEAPALCVALGHPSLRVRYAAEQALVDLGPETSPAVDASCRKTAAGDGIAGARRAPHLVTVAGAWGGKKGEALLVSIAQSPLWSAEAVRAAARSSLETWSARDRNLPASLASLLDELRGDSDWLIRQRHER